VETDLLYKDIEGRGESSSHLALLEMDMYQTQIWNRRMNVEGKKAGLRSRTSTMGTNKHFKDSKIHYEFSIS
jgi:hypothetical protein